MSDDADDLDDDRFDEEDGERSETVVTIEITGLQLFTRHGVTEAEREVGQRLGTHLRLDVGESDATATDMVVNSVDYAQVCQLVALFAQQRSSKTLERLKAALAEFLIS